MRITPARRGRRVATAVAAAAAVVAPLGLNAVTASAAPSSTIELSGEKKSYIVQLRSDPIAVYEGGVQGIPATKPGQGEKVDTETTAAERYETVLREQQAGVLAEVGLDAEAKVYEYTVAFNGFSVELTESQVTHLRKLPDVVNVWENEVRHADTVTTPEYLGMTGEEGVWETQFGGVADAGSGMIVGVIDTGIWPENPSFAPLPSGVNVPADWNGTCQEGADPDPEDNITCNNKVIGARYYAEENTVIDAEFLSPRDYNGHGSHTAGTAAGNYGVEVEIGGEHVGTASGMAPAAHIAVYKALWQTEDGGGSGTSAGLVAAIDDAVADGVDVINYSISGSSTYVVTPDELAFLFAADAGVFVSTSAGNSGDTVGESSVAHNSPWTMTVAASTHDRNVNKYVTIGGEGERVERIKGTDRYGTAAAVAYEFGEVDKLFVATGHEFADALSASSSGASASVAASGSADGHDPDDMSAPVLLTDDTTLPDVTRQAIEDLAPSEIVIVGGDAVVSGDVMDEIDAISDGDEVRRVYGANRYGTSAELAREFGQVDHVYVATGDGFADALAGGALAGHEDVPVLLTHPDVVDDATTDALADLGNPEVIVLGGEAAVSDDVYDALGATERLKGTNRFGTAVAVAEQFGYDGDAPRAFVATGYDYPDALAGSSLAGHDGVPVLLSADDDVPDVTMEQLLAMDPQLVSILGGEAAVSEDAEAELREAFPADEGESYDGVGVGEAVGPAPLVYAIEAGLPGVSEQAARECWLDADNDPGNGQQPTLDPEVVEGHIVLCDRGTVARTDKSAAVAEAGGIGMIQANMTAAESLNADFHSVPSIHVDNVAGEAIRSYALEAEEPTAFISAEGQGEVVAPEMAGFSSYGPALAGGGDLLKPDITAPGVDVIAAVAPPGNNGEDFFSYSGTSMSAPHIAGLAALMMRDKNDWSVAAVKSAMMTTADPLNSEGEPIQRGGEDATPLSYGAGEVEPGAAYNPGLVYHADLDDWFAYACAINQLQLVGGGPLCPTEPIDPSDLNYPSIAIGQLAGEQTVTRTVTNVTGETATFEASVEAPAGTAVTVEPQSITLGADETATFEVTITRTDAALEEYTFGALTWTSTAGHEARSPIAVQPVGMAAPEEISGEGVSGEEEVTVTPGFTGEMGTDVDGLVASDVTVLTPVADGVDGPVLSDAIMPIVVPEGTTTLRVAFWDEEISEPGTDQDLYLANEDGQVIAQSTTAGSDEMVTLEAPEPGTYLVAVDYWSGETGATADVPVHVFDVTDTDEGNLTVDPPTTAVVIGQPTTLTVAWSDLEPDSRYLGAVQYSNGDEVAGRTLVSIVTGSQASL